ncbi:rRNA maturation RNase YbeY [Sulfurimonas sp.]|uniref:rRNA maturation RNase YbeY n=1 Tax=Sulfurimonas sp. TaxID=2022749 RepID=UPI00260DBD06|nr:rRNA maturation RNase YbeY [Sulfurimonas sp.]
MIDIDNRTSLEVNEPFLQTISHSLTDKDIELIITSNAEIQKINKEYREIDKPTDVLSFPYDEMPMAPLGSIVISHDMVKLKAQELGHKESDEFALLFIHGLLHLLDFDHEVDDGEMRNKEEELIKQFDLPISLIVRTEG